MDIPEFFFFFWQIMRGHDSFQFWLLADTQNIKRKFSLQAELGTPPTLHSTLCVLYYIFRYVALPVHPQLPIAIED